MVFYAFLPSSGERAPGGTGFHDGALTTIALSLFRMAKKTASVEPVPLPETYEDAMTELERLVAEMEGGQVPLDRLVEGYRRGAELLAFCRGRLEAVEAQVKVLEDGQLKPWIAG